MRQKLEGDVLSVGTEASIDLSVVCPFFNEEQIIGEAIESLLSHLDRLPVKWELIVVNDGSRDDSLAVASKISERHPNLRVISYPNNRGRGNALKTGIDQARGAIIVTTEIDLSWGEDIVERLYQAAIENPDTDVIVASPHLPGGHYKNVPRNRVLYSRLGNLIIRACMSNAVSMNTGMTRVYRRDAIRSLPLDELGKEFHLEVILKAQALGYRIAEIPAVLEWKEYKHQGQRTQRKSSTKVNKLIVTHSLFSLFGNPVRYVWMLAGIATLFSGGFLVAAVVRYAMGLVSVYMGIMSLALAMIAILLFSFGVIAQQGNMIQREIWRLKQDLWWAQQERNPGGRSDRSE
jgi:glycosyltransferase involved in cell wall biosynthesis